MWQGRCPDSTHVLRRRPGRGRPRGPRHGARRGPRVASDAACGERDLPDLRSIHPGPALDSERISMTPFGKLSPSITSMIRLDHAHAMSTWHGYSADATSTRKKAIADVLCLALEVHAQLEEEIFYPAL